MSTFRFSGPNQPRVGANPSVNVANNNGLSELFRAEINNEITPAAITNARILGTTEAAIVRVAPQIRTIAASLYFCESTVLNVDGEYEPDFQRL